MRFLRRFFIRLSNFTAGRRADQRFREEIAEHVALQTEENLRAGMSPVEARRQAVLKLGAVQAVSEKYHAEEGLPLMENLLQDARYALRMLVKSPGFAAIAILTMALGVGANTAIFSIVDAVLLRSLPYRDPDRLVRVFFNEPGVGLRDVAFSKPELDDLLTRAGVFDDVTPIFEGSENLTGVKQPERVEAVNGSFSYFSMLGVTPQIGRLFGPQDFALGFAPVVVISDALWRRSYGADPGVLGTARRGRDARLGAAGHRRGRHAPDQP